MIGPQFEWDSAKSEANLKKHGISFEEACSIFQGPILSAEDNGLYDESRERSYGLLHGQVVVCVVHTDRGGRCRIISARKATPSERTHFHEYLKKTLS